VSATDGATCPHGCGPFGVTTFDHNRGDCFPLRHLICVLCGEGWAATDDELRTAVAGEYAYDVEQSTTQGQRIAAKVDRDEKLRLLGLA